jgi:PAS domain S-box-containing protein
MGGGGLGQQLSSGGCLSEPHQLTLLAGALELVSDAVVATDDGRQVTYWGPGAERLYGIPAPAALARPLTAAYRERWLFPEQSRMANAALERDGHWRGEVLHVLSDGREVRVDSRVRLLQDPKGGRFGMLSVSRAAAAPPSVARARAGAFLELIEAGCALCRVVFEGERPADLIIEEVNDAFEAHTGLRRDEVLGRRSAELFAGRGWSNDEVLQILLGAAKTGAAQRFVTSVGALGRWCSGEVHRLEPGSLALILRDWHALKEAQRRERECEERFRAAAELFPGPVLVFDARGRVRYANREGLAHPGLSEPNRAVAQTSSRGLPHPPPPLAPHLERAFATGDAQHCEFPSAAGDLAVAIAPLLDEGGAAREAVAVMLEASGRLRAENAARRAAREARRRSAELDAVFDALDEAILVFDASGAVAAANAAARDLLGRDLVGQDAAAWEEICRRVDMRHLGSPHSGADELPSSRALRGYSVRGEVWRCSHPTGTERALEVCAVPLEVDGRRVGSVVALHDVTERQRAENALRQSELLFRTLAENLPDGVARFDRAGRYLYANPAQRRAGNLPADFAGRSDAEMGLAGEPLEILRALSEEVLATGRSAAADFAERAADGVRHWEVRIVPELGPDKQVRSMLTVSRDVTDSKRAEEALRAANDRLELADQRKNAFLAVLSHELRNPLEPIRNSVYVLAHSPPVSDPAQRARRIIERQVIHLTCLVDDLLDVTRIARGKLRLVRQPLDLNQLVRRVAEDQRSVLARGGVELGLEIGDEALRVRGDATRLAQVVANLLQNAAKFTPRGGRATVAVVREQPGVASIRVRDDGAGIAPEAQTHLFEPFVQLEHTLESSRSGLGLGLALVKGLVEQHGGDVQAQSAGLGKGTEFIVRLPLTAEEPRGPRRVLLVDGDEEAAQSLREALECDDHEVEVAATGAQAIEKARAFRPHAVLCDLRLPGMDGCEVARALRQDPELQGLLLISLSGQATEADVERAKRAGFDRHVAKPPDPRALEEALALIPEHH